MRRLIGQRFERLLVVEYVGAGKWSCNCDCGNTVSVMTTNLTSGNSRSCGCLQTERRFKHGMSGTPMHGAWRQMFQRCENPKDPAYHNYGGRGITVCDEWHEFSQFLADMGVRPKGFQLDRIDNEKGYSKGNCRWVTAKANLNNTRANHLISFNGETLTIHQWSEKLGIPATTITYRAKHGWPVEKVLSSDYFWSNTGNAFQE